MTFLMKFTRVNNRVTKDLRRMLIVLGFIVFGLVVLKLGV